jgi:hypothetical protein
METLPIQNWSPCWVNNKHWTSFDLVGWEAGLEDMMLVPNNTIFNNTEVEETIVESPFDFFSTFANALVSICALLLQISRLFP